MVKHQFSKTEKMLLLLCICMAAATCDKLLHAILCQTHSKVYYLWNNVSEKVFNSFHVNFIEHLDTKLVKLFPEITISIDSNAPPSWDLPRSDQHSFPLISSENNLRHMSIPSFKPIFPLHVFDSNPTPPTSDTASDIHLVLSSPNLHASNPPPLCCSSYLKNLHPNTTALLAKFLPLSHSYNLLPLSVADPSLSINLILLH